MKHFIFHIVGTLGVLLSAAAAQDLEQVVRASEGAVLIVTGNDALSGAPIQGSGSCVHPDGYVLAAAHQIVGLANIQGKLKNGEVFDLTPVETLPELDFALLKSDRPMPQAVRLGDARTLVLHPGSTTHSRLKPEEMLAAGISEDMIRVSVGIEDIVDIKADFAAGFKAAKRVAGAV